MQAGARQRLWQGWGVRGALRVHGPSAGPASTAEGWTEPEFLATGSLPVSGRRPEPAFSLKVLGSGEKPWDAHTPLRGTSPP